MHDQFAIIYARLNENNRYWIDERFSIILEHIEHPNAEEVKHARELSVACYLQMIKDQSAKRMNSSKS